MIFVLDACAMIAFLRGEPGMDVVRDVLHDSSSVCVAHAINLCEVYYHFIRVADKNTARAALRDLVTTGIKTRRDMNAGFWMGVGQIKGVIRHVSLADCFAIELCRRLDGEVVTSDRHEFTRIAHDRICRVKFIR